MTAMKPSFLLCTTLATLIALPLRAQTAEERTAIGEAIVTYVSKSNLMPGRMDKVYLEPLVLRGFWKDGAKADTAPARIRDAAELSRLSAPVGGRIITLDIAKWCAGRFIQDLMKECTPELQGSASIALADPRMVGDTAIAVFRTGGIAGISGNNTELGSRRSILYLIKLLPRNGGWSVHCSTSARSDGIPKPQDVEARCKPISP